LKLPLQILDLDDQSVKLSTRRKHEGGVGPIALLRRVAPSLDLHEEFEGLDSCAKCVFAQNTHLRREVFQGEVDQVRNQSTVNRFIVAARERNLVRVSNGVSRFNAQ
jgi:hypothetical protein